jgi:hypothetical protein
MESQIDTSKPNPGRMYDYGLGGTHNFPADREAAEKVFALLPFLPKMAQLQRMCQQDIAETLAVKRGLDVIIDFASGLPTQGHLHEHVPAGTTVIYSDIDPGTVAYGRELVADVPNVYVFQADCRQPEALLARSEVQAVLDGRRDIGMVYWGISQFLAEEDLRHALDYLYTWSGDRSCLAFQTQGAGLDPTHPAMAKALDLYEQMGSPIRFRSLAAYQALVKPWVPDAQGFVSLLEWHDFDTHAMSPEDRVVFGKCGLGYGAYLVKDCAGSIS